MMLGIAMRTMPRRKVVEIADGCFASNVMIFKAKELNRKQINKNYVSLKMQTSFTFWSVWFFKLSDPRSEDTCISIDLALLLHLWLNLWIPFYDGVILMTIKPGSHNTTRTYTALRPCLNECPQRPEGIGQDY